MLFMACFLIGIIIQTIRLVANGFKHLLRSTCFELYHVKR
ncbi:hypothetical protein HPNQ4200_1550 [Helicobacter pylori NQ4200]|uniref:Uncharacterized protein n=1 Tax=Helicobacter pylori NQ4200 TaxID=992024 RepID=J0IQA9_HELPX|nr:hypothetical protein HPNQ4200_1550 [Helicobacter pylori NQ4200]